MNLSAIVIAVMFALLAALACFVLIGNKRRGKNKCIGCPYKSRCESMDFNEDIEEDMNDENEFLDY